MLGLGDRWAPAIIDTEEEGIVLEFGVRDQNNRHSHWIGGSTNRQANTTMRMRHYIPDYTGTVSTIQLLSIAINYVFLYICDSELCHFQCTVLGQCK